MSSMRKMEQDKYASLPVFVTRDFLAANGLKSWSRARQADCLRSAWVRVSAAYDHSIDLQHTEHNKIKQDLLFLVSSNVAP